MLADLVGARLVGRKRTGRNLSLGEFLPVHGARDFFREEGHGSEGRKSAF